MTEEELKKNKTPHRCSGISKYNYKHVKND